MLLLSPLDLNKFAKEEVILFNNLKKMIGYLTIFL